MKHQFLQAFRFVAAAWLAFAAGAAGADAVGPYYATPSWDQQLPASTRFIVLSNWGGTAALDRETGLVWEKSPDATPQNWLEAQYACVIKNVGGRGGWKLPSIQELRSLVDPAAGNPALPAGHPFTNVQSSSPLARYWSATLDSPVFSAGAFLVTFFDGGVYEIDRSLTNLVWCVRGGGRSDAQ